MISPQDKSLLTKFTLLAKKIMYDPDRARSIAKIMDTKDGVVQATMTVLGAVENAKQVPPNIRQHLAVNILITLLDMAEEVMDIELPQGALMGFIGKVVAEVGKGNQPDAQPEQPQQSPQGLIQSQRMGVPA